MPLYILGVSVWSVNNITLFGTSLEFKKSFKSSVVFNNVLKTAKYFYANSWILPNVISPP